MKYNAIGYLIILAMLSGCQTLAALPVTPEITIKIGLKPALVVEREVVSVEETP
jgi:hypothetical protein